MRPLLLIAILFACIEARAPVRVIFGPVSAGHSLNAGLIAYFKMEEASGTRIDSEPTGTPQDFADNNTVTQTTGKIGNAASFLTANGEYLSHADSTDLSGVYAIAGWFNGTTFSADMTIFSHWITTPNERRLLLWYKHSVTQMELQVSNNGTNATTLVDASTFGTPSTGTWYFIYAVYDVAGNTIGISINNGTLNTAAHLTGLYDSEAIVTIGDRGGTANRWNGALDEIGFWNRPLTAGELTYLYNAGAGRTCCAF